MKYARILLSALLLGLAVAGCGISESALGDKLNFTEDKPEYRNKFDYQLANGEKPIRYGYHYVVSRTGPLYRVRVFHPEKKMMTSWRTYSTEALTLLHGPFESYWDDGSIWEQGHYAYGRKHGLWLECQPGKGKSWSGMYVNHKKEGLWTQLDTNGMVEATQIWRDGLRHGKYFEYDGDGEKRNEAIYQADTLVSELFKRPTEQSPVLSGCRQELITNPYTCTEGTLAQLFSTHIRYPETARKEGIEGTAVLQWDVLTDGSVANVRVPHALCDDIEEEVRRVFAMVPGWVPGRKGGQPVKSTLTLPVRFAR